MQGGFSSQPICVTTRGNPYDSPFIAHARNTAVATARALLGQIEQCEDAYRDCLFTSAIGPFAESMLEQILSCYPDL